ncbi:MAG: leucine-rich repeat domain-containing protein, partial [Clostridiales bacterium]|nr:leucine-rich repeat domain-containing protein [Clostridiales bacterium]
MNKIQTRIVFLLVAITITIGLLPGLRVNAAVVASGDCGANGDNVSWTLDDAGVLTISGTGDMEDFHFFEDSSIGSSRLNYPWYEQRNSIKNVVIEDGVTSIGEYSFSSLKKLNSVTISNSVTEIGGSAFSSCSELSSVDLPDNLVSIGRYAFSRCFSLESIEFPDTLTTIDFCAFQDAGLTSITIPGSVTTIGKNAFEKCVGLKTVKLNEGIEIINDSAFIGCEELTNISIPVSVETIGVGAFAYCTGLTSFEADAVLLQKMDFDSVFYGCEQNSITLTAYTFPITYNTCSHGTVSGRTGCPSTDSVEVTVEPDTGYVALEVTVTNSKGTTKINPNDEGKYIFTMPSEAVTVDATFAVVVDSGDCGANGNNVTWVLWDTGTLTISGTGAMADYDLIYDSSREADDAWVPATPWFDYASSINSVVIEDGVTSIGDYAFDYCQNLTSVTIPDSVTSIGVTAFTECTNLKTISIPDSVTSIGNGAFEGCTSLETVSLPGVTSISVRAFKDCTSLTSVTIGSGVTSIDYHAFAECTSLTSVTIPDSVTKIGDYAFGACTNLISITIPDSVTSIGDHAFDICTSLTTVTMNSSLAQECKDNDVFEGCPSSLNINYSDINFTYNSVGNGTVTGYVPGSDPTTVYLTLTPDTGYVVNTVTVTDSTGTTTINPDSNGNYSFPLPTGAVTVNAIFAEIVDSGTCGANGDNVKWTLDDAGVLTISGTGAMADYDY